MIQYLFTILFWIGILAVVYYFGKSRGRLEYGNKNFGGGVSRPRLTKIEEDVEFLKKEIKTLKELIKELKVG